jgi:Arc/MetJ-type ribon-helix-helix transcriptional regulator
MSGHKKTPNAKPIINITIDDELLKKVEDYQFENRIKNRSEAIRQLLLKAMDDLEEKTPQPSKGYSLNLEIDGRKIPEEEVDDFLLREYGIEIKETNAGLDFYYVLDDSGTPSYVGVQSKSSDRLKNHLQNVGSTKIIYMSDLRHSATPEDFSHLTKLEKKQG